MLQFIPPRITCLSFFSLSMAALHNAAAKANGGRSRKRSGPYLNGVVSFPELETFRSTGTHISPVPYPEYFSFLRDFH